MNVEQDKRREVLYRVTPAKCLTLGDIIETRKKLNERKAAETLKAKKAQREAESVKRR